MDFWRDFAIGGLTLLTVYAAVLLLGLSLLLLIGC